jgi:hypothetical protein
LSGFSNPDTSETVVKCTVVGRMMEASVREHADALLREYMARRGLKETLAAMDAESPRGAHTMSSRSAIVKGLKLERLVKRSKERELPTSLLEMLVEALLLNERPLRVEAPNASATAAAPSAPLACGADDWQAVARPSTAGARPPAAHVPEWSRSALGLDEGTRGRALRGTLLVEEEVVDADVGCVDGFVSVPPDRSLHPHALPLSPPSSSSSLGFGALPPSVRPRELGTAAAAQLSELFHGRPHGEWMAAWARQGFGWSEAPCLPFGLHQHRGGTCGVIAAVQALLLRELLLASIDPLSASAEQRNAALVRALAGSLWRIAEAAAADRRASASSSAEAASASLLFFKNERMALPPPRELGREASTLHFASRAEAEACVAARLAQLQRPDGAGVIAFAYSCVLSAGGADAVRAQMDSTGIGASMLIGAHGYCTQELVNLIATGRAVSNVFDGTRVRATRQHATHPARGEASSQPVARARPKRRRARSRALSRGSIRTRALRCGCCAPCACRLALQELDGLVMRGIAAQAPVGLLSLFERYGHVAVGESLKCPQAAVWVTFMESHYTVVFAAHQPPPHPTDPFDLWYYDMLAHQVRAHKLESPHGSAMLATRANPCVLRSAYALPCVRGRTRLNCCLRLAPCSGLCHSPHDRPDARRACARSGRSCATTGGHAPHEMAGRAHQLEWRRPLALTNLASASGPSSAHCDMTLTACH